LYRQQGRLDAVRLTDDHGILWASRSAQWLVRQVFAAAAVRVRRAMEPAEREDWSDSLD
jgi:hypothetical protein